MTGVESVIRRRRTSSLAPRGGATASRPRQILGLRSRESHERPLGGVPLYTGQRVSAGCQDRPLV